METVTRDLSKKINLGNQRNEQWKRKRKMTHNLNIFSERKTMFLKKDI